MHILTNGAIPPNPSELLVSPKMLKLLEKCKQVFDITIIDGTPCELVTDAVILSRIVDSTIIVTAHKLTKKDALERVIKNIQNVGGNLTGVVVNKMPISGKKYEKQYYYYGDSSRKLEIEPTNLEIEKPKEIKQETTEKPKKTTTKKTTTKKSTTETKQTKPKTNSKAATKATKTTKSTTSATNVSDEKKSEETTKEERTSDILKQMNEYLNKEKGEKND